ncbi:MAG: SsrA-binding protein SmpB [Nitrosarchaeum sp.]|nr:SsrA-binding protein SmpB [Nitrosarchaeum sp.]
MSKNKKTSDAELANNRKAFHNYDILDTFEAGIALVGTEVKSLRDHGGSIQDAYVVISENEALLKNASIAPYNFGNIHNHEERRTRKLLLHKRELAKLDTFCREKGLTLVALAMYLKNGLVKVKIAVARGKKLHDKRSALKEREQKRSIDRAYHNDQD